MRKETTRTHTHMCVRGENDGEMKILVAIKNRQQTQSQSK